METHSYGDHTLGPRCPRTLLAIGMLLAFDLWSFPSSVTATPPHFQAQRENIFPVESYVFTPGLRSAALPTEVKPSDIIIDLQPDYKNPLEDTTDFSGHVIISFRVSKSTKEVTLHAHNDMGIQKVIITNRNDKEVDIDDYTTTEDILKITMKSNLATSNSYKARIEFTGKIQNNVFGFYKSTYKKENGNTGVLFTTQFKPVGAHRAFPCFDEPSFRTTYTLTIAVPPGYDAISNTAVQSRAQTKDGTTESITFKQTPSMPSYLVAFTVYKKSSFVPSHVVLTENGIPITSWARKDAVENKLLHYSQDVTFKILRKLDEFTALPYNTYMEKLDQVAIPDFSAAGMENWGIVMYHEQYLLFNETSDSESKRHLVTKVIAHELSHQWFGNLVTTTWWDTMWLNEGFANYFEYLVLSWVFPSWRMMDILLLNEQMSVFVEDSLSSTVPLNRDVSTEEEITGQFGNLVYSKGSCIVRMMHNILGDNNFKSGLQKYLKSGPASVTPKDLFSALSSYLPAERKPEVGFDKAMDSWTSLPGYPVVRIERDYYAKTVNISQQRFLTDGTTESEPTLYHVPLAWISRDNSDERFMWLSQRSVVLKDDVEMEYWWLVRSSYFRVNYDEFTWGALAYTLSGDQQALVAPADRAKLLDDALVLAREGQLSYRVLGYLLRYLPKETDVVPWAAASTGLEYFDIVLGNNDKDDVIYSFLRKATEAAFEALSGFSRRGDSPELILRNHVLKWACRAGHRQCLGEATTLLQRFVYDKAPLDPNLEETILCYGARNISKSMWEDLWVLYTKATDSATQISYLNALACNEERNHIFTLLQRVAKGEYGANSNDTVLAFQAVLTHPKGIAASLDFVIEKLHQMRQWLSEETINQVLVSVTDVLTSEEQKKRISNFLENEIVNNLIDEKFADDLKAKVEKQVSKVQLFAEEALKAFADSIPKEEVKAEPLEPEEPSGGGGQRPVFSAVTLMCSIVILRVFVSLSL